MPTQRPKNPVRYWIGKTFLSALGWETEGAVPTESKYVMIAAPHTTNWDLPVMLALAYVFEVRISWMGKHTLFEWPFGEFFRQLGGVPVDRRGRHDLVQQMVDLFTERDELILAIPPEGTRSKTRYWKSGFYHIARGANVPIALGFLDYKRRVGGYGPMIMPTSDMEADVQKIRAFYATITAKYPEEFVNIEFRPASDRDRTTVASGVEIPAPT